MVVVVDISGIDMKKVIREYKKIHKSLIETNNLLRCVRNGVVEANNGKQ